MVRYIVRRLIRIPAMLLGVSLITFLMLHLAPGNPLDRVRIANPTMGEEDIARLARALGLDRSLPEQYFIWIGNLVQGDFGESLVNRRPVLDQILERIPATLLLTSSALMMGLLIAVPLGVLAATRRNSWIDHFANGIGTLGFAIPGFWLGLLLILIFAVQAREWGLPAFPSGGSRSYPSGGSFGDRFYHLILPMTALGMVETATWLRFVRSQMLEALHEDFVRTARSKGLRERVVVIRHGLRTALLPLVTMFGLSLPGLFGGAAIIEGVFTWPGVGSLALDAASNKDFTMIMGITVLISTVTLVGNLLADIGYAIVDPRIRLD